MRIDSSKLLVWGAILVAVVMAVAQEANKEWTIRRTDNADILRFTIRRFRPGSTWANTFDVPRSRFQGLSIDTLEHGGAAKFTFVQDAGNLECRGRFSWGTGSGDYTFVPNPGFVAELRKLGYDTPDQDELFSMMMSNITLEFARGVKESGLQASVDDLMRLRNHGVNLEFITTARRAGYQNFTVEDFTNVRDHGVNREFLVDLKTYGYKLDAHDMTQLRDHGVQASFMRDLKDAGYDLTAHEITDLRDHGVNSEEMRELRHYGLQPSASDLTRLRDHGVTPAYLSRLKDAGYGKLSPEDVMQLHDHGVDASFAQQAHDLGYNFTAGELVRLRDHGVDGGYLRKLHDSGMPTLSAEQIEKLRDHGIE
jgi:hypothetical protein